MLILIKLLNLFGFLFFDLENEDVGLGDFWGFFRFDWLWLYVIYLFGIEYKRFFLGFYIVDV